MEASHVLSIQKKNTQNQNVSQRNATLEPFAENDQKYLRRFNTYWLGHGLKLTAFKLEDTMVAK